MSQYISNFKNNCLNVWECSKEFAKSVVTVDRSGQVFGTTREAQLKGRDKQITIGLIATGIITLMFAYCLTQAIMHPGAMTYFMTASTGFFAAVSFKELALQSIHRAKEKKEADIEHENEETLYSLREMAHDFKASILKDCKTVVKRSTQDDAYIEMQEKETR